MKRVLLVDDHDLFRQVLAVVLAQHTDLKENVQAGSLGEARRELAELDAKVDLAVIDFDLPDEDATELIQKLHELDVPVLAFTDVHSLEKRTRALKAGADEVLVIASSGEKIVGVVNRLISE